MAKWCPRVWIDQILCIHSPTDGPFNPSFWARSHSSGVTLGQWMSTEGYQGLATSAPHSPPSGGPRWAGRVWVSLPPDPTAPPPHPASSLFLPQLLPAHEAFSTPWLSQPLLPGEPNLWHVPWKAPGALKHLVPFMWTQLPVCMPILHQAISCEAGTSAFVWQWRRGDWLGHGFWGQKDLGSNSSATFWPTVGPAMLPSKSPYARIKKKKKYLAKLFEGLNMIIHTNCLVCDNKTAYLWGLHGRQSSKTWLTLGRNSSSWPYKGIIIMSIIACEKTEGQRGSTCQSAPARKWPWWLILYVNVNGP